MSQSTGRGTTIAPMPRLPESRQGTGMTGTYGEALRSLPDDAEVTIRMAGGSGHHDDAITAEKRCLRWSDSSLMVIREIKQASDDGTVEMAAEIIPADAIASVKAKWVGRRIERPAEGASAANKYDRRTERKIGFVLVGGERCGIWQSEHGGLAIESGALGRIAITLDGLMRLLETKQAIVPSQDDRYVSLFSGWDMSEAADIEEHEVYDDLFA